MRKTFLLAMSSLLALSVAACGDDTETTEGGGGSGAGTEGGGGTEPVGAGGEGAGESEGGGGTAPQLDQTASSCEQGDSCEGGVCMEEPYFGWAGGYCTALCDEELSPCEGTDACVGTGTGGPSICVATCATDADCPGVAQTCEDIGSEAPLLVCIGGCDDDAQCDVTCNADILACVLTAEECDGGEDEDQDFGEELGFIDCEDADCAADATCSEIIAGACTGAVDVSAGGDFAGDTADGTAAFATLCTSIFGATIGGGGTNGLVHKYTAPAAGVVTFNVTSEGGVDWWVRSDCDDANSSIGFCGFENNGLGLPVAAGEELYVYVDAFGEDTEFNLNVNFDTPADACGAATAITLGTTNGDTTTGSAGLLSSCGGGGNEVVYTYTPAADGMLDITLSAETDQGFSIRTTCATEASETECADLEFGGDDEVATVAVTAGTPITIIVDAYSVGEEGPFTLVLE